MGASGKVGAIHSRKAFLLARNEPGTPHEYAQSVERTAARIGKAFVEGLLRANPSATVSPHLDVAHGADFVPTVRLVAGSVEAECDLLTRVPGRSQSRSQYEPTIVVGTHVVLDEHRERLTYIGYVLGTLQGRPPARGTIVTADQVTHRVSLGRRSKSIGLKVEILRASSLADAATEPAVMLNRHCPTCPFQAACLAKATASDDLTLLNRMTPRLLTRYRKKGIFTVNQLSYVFRPRRSKKRPLRAGRQFNVELQALAIRTGKVYLQDLPTLSRAPCELFIDFEGIPDERFYYLLGVLVVSGASKRYHAHWIDERSGQADLWAALKGYAAQYPKTPIYHYGSYEPKAIEELARKAGDKVNTVKPRLVNLSSHIFGRVYFPVRSNTLKDIGRFVGAEWRSLDASGLQSLVWRQAWEESGAESQKKKLVRYNEDDCRALLAIVEYIGRLKDDASGNEHVDFAHQPKQHTTEVGATIHAEFKRILKSAHLTYDRSKIRLRGASRASAKVRQPVRGNKRAKDGRAKVVRVRPRRLCPSHAGEILTPSRTRFAKAIVTDLVFRSTGCRKTVTKYVGPQGFCNGHRDYYNPTAIHRLRGRRFGQGFFAWVGYLRVILRLPYEMISRVAGDMLGIDVCDSVVVRTFAELSDDHSRTERGLEKAILSSPFVHVDETRLNIQGRNQYVWVFTDGRHVIFRLTATRETTVVHKLLDGYEGVLVSDFYPGYDALPCRQQKCLVHLIRDMNDDLWSNAFDRELEVFVSEVRDLLVPMLGAAKHYGPKVRYLRKFRREVDRFYKRSIDARSYESDATIKFQNRFDRYRDSLFVFLEVDGLPWENNMAERAIRQLAVQRKISGFFYEDGARRYLRLLAIAQSCRFQEKSFLRFLLSGTKNLDAFKGSERRR